MGLFTMPSLGADMDRGTLVEWRVRVGDRVQRGDVIAVVDTEKSTIDAETFESGVIAELLVPVGTEVDVGTPLARIEAEAEPAAEVPSAAPTPEVAAPEAPPVADVPPVAGTSAPEPAPWPHPGPGQSAVDSPLVRREAEHLGVDPSQVVGSGPGHRVTRADVEAAAARRSERGSSPAARRLARERGVDLGNLSGTGPGGAVRSRDVPPPGAAPTSAPPEPTSSASGTPSVATAEAPRAGVRGPAERQRSMREAIARQMSRSNAEIPHYHLTMTIDLHATLEGLAARNADRPASERLLLAAVLTAAAARSFAAVPQLNGTWVDGGFVPADGVHLAVVVSLRDGGLVAPVIRDAASLSVADTMVRLRDLVTRARRGALRSSDLADASCTMTDLGERGADAVFGVIHPPQVALVGFGGVVERPWAVDGLVGVRPTITATLSGDHRATDGHVGNRLLEHLRDLLTDPARLADDPGGPR